MEDYSDRLVFTFCVHDTGSVAPPIISRCTTLQFDIGVLNSKTGKLNPHPYVNMSSDEWIKEVKRVGSLVAKNAGVKVSDKQLNQIATRDLYLIDIRRFMRSLEEQVNMELVG